jgi:Flp pilus assembly protein TadG
MRWKRIITGTRGQEIAEAAVVLPLMMMFLLGIYWFGRAYNIYGTITHAAREGARTATAPTCAMCGNVATTQDQVADKIADILKASKLDPAKVSAITPALCDCGTPSCGTPVACATVTSGKAQVCVQRNVLLNANTSNPPACGVAVSFRYPYQFWLPFTSLNKQLIQLRAQAEATGED